MIRCWQCGVESDDVFEVFSGGSAEPVNVLCVWPAGDHEHALSPPTPAQLEAAGSAALARVIGEWATSP